VDTVAATVEEVVVAKLLNPRLRGTSGELTEPRSIGDVVAQVSDRTGIGQVAELLRRTGAGASR
jgi:hypothetical protein